MRPAALLLLAACLPLLNACRTDDLPGMDSDDNPPAPEELVGQPVNFGGLTVAEVTTDATTRTVTRTATLYSDPGATITVKMTVTPATDPPATLYADYTCTSGGSWIPVDSPLYWTDATSTYTFTAYSPVLSTEEKSAGGRSAISLPQEWGRSLYEDYSKYMRSATIQTTPVRSVSLTLKLQLARVLVSMQNKATTYGQQLTMFMRTHATPAGDGSVSVSTGADNPIREVKLWKDGNVFRGYTLPGQTYAKGDPILYHYEYGAKNPQLYKLTSAITTQVGNQLKFTVEALPGFSVNVSSAGGLKSAIEAYAAQKDGTYPPRIVITGALNIDDIRTLVSLGEEGKIISVDMSEASMSADALGNNPIQNPEASKVPFYASGFNSPISVIKSIILPKNLTLISGYAFYGYPLDNLVLPDALQDLGSQAITTNNSMLEIPANMDRDDKYFNSAFWGCSKLTTVVVHCPLENLGRCFFYDCSALSQIILKGDALQSKEVKESTFKNCNLTSIDFLPPSVTTLGKEAFYGCNFKTLDIPARVTEVGEIAFYDSNVESVTIRANMDKWGHALFASGYDSTTGLKEVTFADDALKTKEFLYDPFSGCEYLTSIVLPPSLEHFFSKSSDRGVFDGCTTLKKIAIDGSIAISGNITGPSNGVPDDAELFLYNPSLGETGNHVTTFAGDKWANHTWANVHWGYKGTGDKLDAKNYSYHKNN